MHLCPKVILIPIALFIITIAIVEKTDAVESTKRAFSFVAKNLVEVLAFIIIAIVIWALLDLGFAFIPVIGAYLGAIVVWLAGTVLARAPRDNISLSFLYATACI